MQAQSGGSSYHATDGAAYEVFLGRWTRRLAEPLLDFAEFPDAGRLLDVGCGTGALATAMAARRSAAARDPSALNLLGLAPDLRARVEAAVATSYRAGSPDGPRSMTATAWVVRGRVR
jgi:SAM-dependent methyltransferase